jgi:hypothetical protein
MSLGRHHKRRRYLRHRRNHRDYLDCCDCAVLARLTRTSPASRKQIGQYLGQHFVNGQRMEGEVPSKLSPAVRQGVFYGSLPFIFLLIAVDRYFAEHGTRNEVIACIVLAFLSLIVAVYWDRFLPARWRRKSETSLAYLHHEDAGLGSAIRDMAWDSAWGKWYASQQLANVGKLDETELMRVAASNVTEALVNGKLKARGRQPGQLDYEEIPRTHWHSTVPYMVPDNKTLWKMVLLPTGGVEKLPGGMTVMHDVSAAQRTDQLRQFDSIIVDAREFEKLWPRKDARVDVGRKQFLKKAKKAGVDAATIERFKR